jgi:acyl-coenzyme A thioesterase PaaI-like protein
MDMEHDYTLLPVKYDNRCFACGPANAAGLKMRFYAGTESVVSWVTVPEHLRGWSTLVHGGVISTILDEIMSWTAIHLIKSVILTKSMTVEFKKPIHVEQKLKAVGKIAAISGDREVKLEGFLFNSEGLLCACAAGVFALLKPKVALKLGVVDKAELEQFVPKTETR